MARIFLSYAREDADSAGALAAKLRLAEQPTWFDRDISGGQAWWDNVRARIAQSDLFVHLLSRNSFDAAYCQAQLTEARRLTKPIILVLLDASTPIPTEVTRLPPLDLSAGITTQNFARLRAAIDQAYESRPKGGQLWASSTPLPEVTPARKRRSRKGLSRRGMLAGLMLTLVFLALLFGGLNVAQRLAHWGIGEALTSTVETLQPAYTPVVIPTLRATERVPPTATPSATATATTSPTSETPRAFATPTALIPESTPEVVRIIAEDTLLRVPLPNDAVIVLQPSSELSAESPDSPTYGLWRGEVFLDAGSWERAAILIPDRGIEVSGSRVAVQLSTGSVIVTAACYRGPCSATFAEEGVVRELTDGQQIFFNTLSADYPNDPVLPLGQTQVDAYNVKCQNCLSAQPGADVIGVVIADPQADLRNLPTAISEVVGAAARDDRLPITGRSEDSAWLQVRTVALQLVWIEAAAVQVEGDLASAPLVGE